MDTLDFIDDSQETIRHEAVSWVTTQPLELVIVAAVIVGATIALRWTACTIGHQLEKEAGSRVNSWNAIIARLLRMTRWWWIVAVGMQISLQFLEAPPFMQRLIGGIFTVACVIQAAIWLRHLLISLLARKVEHHEGVETLASALSILRLIITFIIWFAAFIFILDNFGVEVTTLLAGLGVGGLAVGLAAQGIVSDLFAALSIIFDKPFKLGDFIVTNETIGTVEKIGLKNVRIRALSGECLIVPNAKLLENQIHNYKGPFERRIEQRFTIAGTTEISKVLQLADEVKEVINTTPNCRLDRCHVKDISLYGFEYEMVYFIVTDDYNLYMDVRHLITTGILLRLQKLGVTPASAVLGWLKPVPNG